MSRLVVRRLRIEGLQGRAPTRQEVEAAVRSALAVADPAAVRPTPALRISAARTLTDAADAVAAGIGGRRGGR